MARMLSRRSSRLQNTSLEDMGRWEGRSLRESRERFILSRRGPKRCGAFLLMTLLPPLTSPSAEDDLPLTTGDSARDCSASSSVSISYDDVSSGSVANNLEDCTENIDEREDIDDDENDRVLLVLRLVRADMNAAELIEEEYDAVVIDRPKWR